MDLFEKLIQDKGPLGVHSQIDHNFYMFPRLEGEIGPRMKFMKKNVLNWSINNYLGFANHPEIRKIDAEAATKWGLAAPMGARMMTGNTTLHEKLEEELAKFEKKEATMLLNYGYQGIMSIIDTLVDRKDVIVYDAECHASIIDGLRLHIGKRFVFKHNNIEDLEIQLKRALKITEETQGGILVISEGVFGMSGNMGKLDEIVALKKKYSFRLLVDDAHGFGTIGKTGMGCGEEKNAQNEIDLYFSTFAKSMASIGAFVSGNKDIIDNIKYKVRSQIFAKSLPLAFVEGNLKRLEMIRTQPEHKEKLWKIVNAIQNNFRNEGFNIGSTTSPVTPVILKGGVYEAVNLVRDLRFNYSIFCSAIIYPVVPKDMIILRIIPTAAHTIQDVEETISAFKSVKINLDNGIYLKQGKEAALKALKEDILEN